MVAIARSGYRTAGGAQACSLVGNSRPFLTTEKGYAPIVLPATVPLFLTPAIARYDYWEKKEASPTSPTRSVGGAAASGGMIDWRHGQGCGP